MSDSSRSRVQVVNHWLCGARAGNRHCCALQESERGLGEQAKCACLSCVRSLTCATCQVILLYFIGQSMNVVVTFGAAYLAFGVLYRDDITDEPI
jgi:hypothetical protein